MIFKRILMIVLVVVFYGCDDARVSMSSSAGNGVSQKKNQEDAKVIDLPKDSLRKAQSFEQNANGFRPFFVYEDRGSRNNHYVPSGFMGDWKCLDFDDNWKEGCKDGSSCIKISYDVACSSKLQKWCGIYWLNPPNNWGTRKGGYNLTGAQKLVFWARGAKGGEQIQEFKVGGIGNNYPDTDTAAMGPIVLTSVWQEYSIDLSGKDLSYISGGFVWTTSTDVNDSPCVFYLDHIRFE